MSTGACGVPPPAGVLNRSRVCSLGRKQIVWIVRVEEVGVRLAFSFPGLK